MDHVPSCNYLMPTSSAHQLVISAALQHAHHLQAQYHQQQHQLQAQYDPSHESSSSNSGSQSSSDCLSATSTSTSTSTSSSSSSNSDSESTHPSDLVSEDSNDATDQALNTLCQCYLLSTYCAHSFIALLLSTHRLFPHHVAKCSQLGLILDCYIFDDAHHFQLNLHISPSTFDALCSLIQDHPAFYNNSNQEQMPVSYQLAIALFHFGHFGNGSSVEKVAQWAGCSASSVVKATCHVIAAFLPLHEQAVQWPNSEEKCSASDWVESVSCHAWWPGFCMVDGMLIPLFSKLGHFGEQFFDHKSNYSLSLTVWVSFISWDLITNFFAACHIAKSLYH